MHTGSIKERLSTSAEIESVFRQDKTKMPPTDKEILENVHLKADGLKYLTRVVQYWGGSVCNVLRKKGASQEQFMLCFKEGIAALYMNIVAGKFKGKSSLKTYFTSICENIWLKKLRDVKKQAHSLPLDEAVISNIKIEEDNFEISDMLMVSLQQIEEPCRTIMKETMEGKNLIEIANLLNISYATIKRRNISCSEKFLKILKQNGYEQ